MTKNRHIKIKIEDFNKYLERTKQGCVADYTEEEHFDLLDVIKEYLIEELDKGYSWDNIGDNTDFEIEDNKIVVDVEIILD